MSRVPFNAVVVLFFVFFVVVAAAFLVVVDFAVFVEAFVSATFVVFGFDATRFFGVFVVFVVVVVAGIEVTWVDFERPACCKPPPIRGQRCQWGLQHYELPAITRNGSRQQPKS